MLTRVGGFRWPASHPDVLDIASVPLLRRVHGILVDKLLIKSYQIACILINRWDVMGAITRNCFGCSHIVLHLFDCFRKTCQMILDSIHASPNSAGSAMTPHMTPQSTTTLPPSYSLLLYITHHTSSLYVLCVHMLWGHCQLWWALHSVWPCTPNHTLPHRDMVLGNTRPTTYPFHACPSYTLHLNPAELAPPLPRCDHAI